MVTGGLIRAKITTFEVANKKRYLTPPGAKRIIAAGYDVDHFVIQ